MKFVAKRVLIGFTDVQIAWLEREARKRRVPVSGLVRQLVDARRSRP